MELREDGAGLDASDTHAILAGLFDVQSPELTEALWPQVENFAERYKNEAVARERAAFRQPYFRKRKFKPQRQKVEQRAAEIESGRTLGRETAIWVVHNALHSSDTTTHFMVGLEDIPLLIRYCQAIVASERADAARQREAGELPASIWLAENYANRSEEDAQRLIAILPPGMRQEFEPPEAEL